MRIFSICSCLLNLIKDEFPSAQRALERAPKFSPVFSVSPNFLRCAVFEKRPLCRQWGRGVCKHCRRLVSLLNTGFNASY